MQLECDGYKISPQLELYNTALVLVWSLSFKFALQYVIFIELFLDIHLQSPAPL